MHPKEFLIKFHFQKRVFLRHRRQLKLFISKQLENAGKSGGEINFVFCSDEDLLQINKTHLNHDYFTDIITFDLSETGSSFLISDIYISIDRVKDNARLLKNPIGNELLRVIFHGVLHLIGFKDKSKADMSIMREMENEWIQLFNECST